MRLVANLVHLLTGGLVLALAWLAAALLVAPLAATRPLAGPCLQLAFVCLWPRGKDVVREERVELFQKYVRTGKRPDGSADNLFPYGASRVQVLLWLPLGAALACAHLAHGIIVALPTFSNPWRTRSASLLITAVFPLGWRVARLEQLRAMRAAGHPGRWARASDPDETDVLAQACGRIAKPLATIGCAGLVLWASSSANEALLYSPTIRFESPQHLPGYASRVRPRPGPALLVVHRNPPEVADQGCFGPTASVGPVQLSRSQTGYALPLGSRQMRIPAGARLIAPLRNVQHLATFAGAARHAKAKGAPCVPAITGRIARTTPFVKARALAARLTSKAPPETVLAISGRRLIHFGGGQQSAAQLRNVLGIQRMAGSVSSAKVPGVIRPDQIASRIAKASVSFGSPASNPIR